MISSFRSGTVWSNSSICLALFSYPLFNFLTSASFTSFGWVGVQYFFSVGNTNFFKPNREKRYLTSLNPLRASWRCSTFLFLFPLHKHSTHYMWRFSDHYMLIGHVDHENIDHYYSCFVLCPPSLVLV